MRIIDARQDDFKSWTYEVICSACVSKLELSAGDLKTVVDPRDGDYAVCKCPVCKRDITIARNLIPQLVWARLKG